MKKLFEEALADVRQVKEVAEQNAKRAILEQLSPKIQEMLELELDSLGNESEEEFTDSPSPIVMGEPAVDDVVDDLGVAVSAPDADGKVILDLDALSPEALPTTVNQTQEEFVVDSKAANQLGTLVGMNPAQNVWTPQTMFSELERVDEKVQLLSKASSIICETREYFSQIQKEVTRVEDMYRYVRENFSLGKERTKLEEGLEEQYRKLSELQEKQMKNRRRINEGDVVVKLTGLPDDVDLDQVGVDLITGDEEGGDEEVDLDAGDEAGDEELDLDLGEEGDEELSGEEAGNEDEELGENAIVEINEAAVYQEIKRLRSLREAATAKKAHTPKSAVKRGKPDSKSFGGSKAGTEPLNEEDEVTDEATTCEEETKTPMTESRKQNLAAARQRSAAESNGRNKLAETNLDNAKLRLANKLLQNESLTPRQKAHIIKQFDRAQTIREAHLIYATLAEGVEKTSPRQPSRVIGSSSVTTRSASTTAGSLTENIELDRWSVLAGIKK